MDSNNATASGAIIPFCQSGIATKLVQNLDEGLPKDVKSTYFYGSRVLDLTCRRDRCSDRTGRNGGK